MIYDNIYTVTAQKQTNKKQTNNNAKSQIRKLGLCQYPATMQLSVKNIYILKIGSLDNVLPEF